MQWVVWFVLGLNVAIPIYMAIKDRQERKRAPPVEEVKPEPVPFNWNGLFSFLFQIGIAVVIFWALSKGIFSGGGDGDWIPSRYD